MLKLTELNICFMKPRMSQAPPEFPRIRTVLSNRRAPGPGRWLSLQDDVAQATAEAQAGPEGFSDRDPALGGL